MSMLLEKSGFREIFANGKINMLVFLVVPQ